MLFTVSQYFAPELFALIGASGFQSSVRQQMMEVNPLTSHMVIVVLQKAKQKHHQA
jgi:2-polyprenyl-6-methoxyphenol hydroxylase-like FAD-dependent oxidoreductase